MPVAARAPVKPRILASATRAALPLEDEVQTLLDGRGQMLVALGGEPGGGKSTASRIWRLSFRRRAACG